MNLTRSAVAEKEPIVRTALSEIAMQHVYDGYSGCVKISTVFACS